MRVRSECQRRAATSVHGACHDPVDLAREPTASGFRIAARHTSKCRPSFSDILDGIRNVWEARGARDSYAKLPPRPCFLHLPANCPAHRSW